MPGFTYDVSTWFVQLEAVWSGVTDFIDQQRYQDVVRVLPLEVAARLSGVLAEPPTDNKYEPVKSALLTTFGKTPAVYFSALDTVSFDGCSSSALLACIVDLSRAACGIHANSTAPSGA